MAQREEIRPKGLRDVLFQGGLVAFDREEIVATAIVDGHAYLSMSEDRVPGDDDAPSGAMFSAVPMPRLFHWSPVPPAILRSYLVT